MEVSTIGWCDFSGGSANFVTGCTPVSEGCANCYARSIYERFGRAREFERVRFDGDKLRRLARTRWPEYSPKRGAPHRPTVFVCDTGDLFHEAVQDAQVRDALRAMNRAANVNWVVLTKRAERMHNLLVPFGRLPEHIWLGVSVENDANTWRLEWLKRTPAAMRFVSIEPMLGPVTLSDAGWLDWVIVGAESGPRRRPFDVAWAASVKERCAALGVPFFGKQASGLRPGAPLLFDGEECKQWPGSRS